MGISDSISGGGETEKTDSTLSGSKTILSSFLFPMFYFVDSSFRLYRFVPPVVCIPTCTCAMSSVHQSQTDMLMSL
ncbi:hypothetical protein HanRHA438_Chr11g0504001 [Helianthus annuus]|nr:hypothetical protein HanRHA438_Chr11g0504001 [Helianthus annuus]